MVRLSNALPTGVPLGGTPLEAVVMGASTGGPPAVEAIVASLPHTFPAPIIVCQHMPPGFTELWAERLDGVCHMRAKEAAYGELLEPGTVYIAPIGYHLRFRRENGEVSAVLDRDFADSLHVPSIDFMMSSAAQAYGSKAMGVLLTGLGSDGALGMLAMRQAGCFTVCQAEESALAPSMPVSAKQLGAAAEEAELEELAHLIAMRVSGRA